MTIRQTGQLQKFVSHFKSPRFLFQVVPQFLLQRIYVTLTDSTLFQTSVNRVPDLSFVFKSNFRTLVPKLNQSSIVNIQIGVIFTLASVIQPRTKHKLEKPNVKVKLLILFEANYYPCFKGGGTNRQKKASSQASSKNSLGCFEEIFL